MLLGFPLDYWTIESIQNAIGNFGKMMLWENDRGHHLCAIILSSILKKGKKQFVEVISKVCAWHKKRGF
jgi:hypothetical protein